MVGIVRLLVAISSLTLLVRAAPSPPKYVELYTEQMVDHFNYELQDTFMERYFLSGEQPAVPWRLVRHLVGRAELVAFVYRRVLERKRATVLLHRKRGGDRRVLRQHRFPVRTGGEFQCPDRFCRARESVCPWLFSRLNSSLSVRQCVLCAHKKLIDYMHSLAKVL